MLLHRNPLQHPVLTISHFVKPEREQKWQRDQGHRFTCSGEGQSPAHCSRRGQPLVNCGDRQKFHCNLQTLGFHLFVFLCYISHCLFINFPEEGFFHHCKYPQWPPWTTLTEGGKELRGNLSLPDVVQRDIWAGGRGYPQVLLIWKRLRTTDWKRVASWGLYSTSSATKEKENTQNK